jgi:UDP-N-acetylmuramate--alanine ligase
MKLDNVHSVFFVGIGGIGMSALARWFNQRGKKVGGYDRVSTPLTQKLENEGIDIHYSDNVKLIHDDFLHKDSTLIIYTPAIPVDHFELTYFMKNSFQVMKRSEVLGLITEGHFTIAVAGTHGKTTTSSMIAHLLNGSQHGCSAFVGGIMSNYDSNLIIGDENAPVVVEADEFDRSFMRLHPDFTIVTSIDPDHLDIYGDKDTIQQSYLDFMQLTDREGKVLLHEIVADQVGNKLARAFSTYGLKSAQIRAMNIRIEEGDFVFDYVGKTEIANIKIQLPGFHNISNAVAAITAALYQDMNPELIKDRMMSYTGVKRRFEYIIRTDSFTYIDDYAHHPSEIESFLTAVRKLYPEKKITTIFQPHLYSRTRDFQTGFAKSLDLSDEVLLLDIYPAREKPIEGVTSRIIFDKMKLENKVACSLEDFPDILRKVKTDVLVTVGAGDIDTLVPKVKDFYLNKEKVEA